MEITGLITGWENIAKLLGVSVRTAKTFYYEYSMPVRKFPGGRIVSIIPEEVQIWIIHFTDSVKEIEAREARLRKQISKK